MKYSKLAMTFFVHIVIETHFGVLRDIFPDDAEYCRKISNSTLQCYANIAETHLFTRVMDDETL